MTHGMPSHKQAALEQDAIDISGVQLFDEASIKNLNETDDGSPSLVEGTLEDIGTVADRDTTSMAKMGVVTKAVVGAASEIELAVTAGSVAASEVVMADIDLSPRLSLSLREGSLSRKCSLPHRLLELEGSCINRGGESA